MRRWSAPDRPAGGGEAEFRSASARVLNRWSGAARSGWVEVAKGGSGEMMESSSEAAGKGGGGGGGSVDLKGALGWCHG